MTLARRVLQALALAGAAAAIATPVPSVAQDTLQPGRYGTARLFRPPAAPTRVVLFLSGDGGWTAGVAAMAASLAGEGALVIGLDMRNVRAALEHPSGRCAYPAADLETVSHYVQQRLRLPAYHPPVLVGYSGGASLAYAALAQAPPNTFAGTISLGFCPELLLSTPLCTGHGLPSGPGRRRASVRLRPAPDLSAPWIVLHGTEDRVCPLAVNTAFVQHVRGARLMPLPAVGHGFGHPADWHRQLGEALRALPEATDAVEPSVAAVRDLPLIEVPAKSAGGRRLAVILSGDGGWAGIDRELGAELASRGIPVVGLNSLQYFWSPRTPAGAAADLERIVQHYLAAWQRDRLLLVGYSRGADVLPFLVNRLPARRRAAIDLVALLGTEQHATFEFRLGDWFRTAPASGLPTAPEIVRLHPIPVLCIYGTRERESVCPVLPSGAAIRLRTPGGHHFGGAYRALADTIIAHLP